MGEPDPIMIALSSGLAANAPWLKTAMDTSPTRAFFMGIALILFILTPEKPSRGKPSSLGFIPTSKINILHGRM
jgi:hypothetical protein